MPRPFHDRLERNLDQRRERLLDLLQEARRERKLSQYLVAKLLGITQTEVSRIECGKRRLDAVELETLATLYGKRLSDFATWEYQKERDRMYAEVLISEGEFEILVKYFAKKVRTWRGFRHEAYPPPTKRGRGAGKKGFRRRKLRRR